jgi:hypothetical protein
MYIFIFINTFKVHYLNNNEYLIFNFGQKTTTTMFDNEKRREKHKIK